MTNGLEDREMPDEMLVQQYEAQIKEAEGCLTITICLISGSAIWWLLIAYLLF